MGCSCSKTATAGPLRGKPLPSLLGSSLKLHLSSFDGDQKTGRGTPGMHSRLSSTRSTDLENESGGSTSSSVSWEMELLQVSSDLEQKLKDPHFVAKCCDLDGSGDLDMHELGHAARVFGMKLSAERLQQLMAGAKRASKERFAEVVAEPVVPSERTRPTVPHSLRGMALGQLQHLEALFIQSGWLAAQCDAYNAKHADAIRKKEKGFFHQVCNLYSLDAYVVSPMSKPGHCAARDHDRAGSVPPATDKMSFSSLLNPHGLLVHCFVSHFWGKLFSETVTALRLWAEQYQRSGAQGAGTCPKSVVFWICLFAVNQHDVAYEVGDSPMQGPFNAAIAKAKGGAVMVLDQDINPFKRIWCLFEVSRLKELDQPFELICEMGSLSRPESLEGAFKAKPDALKRILQATVESLWTVSAINAQASVIKDKVHIWQEIANPGSRKVIGGMYTLLCNMQHSDELPEESQFWLTDFDRYIQSLLSTALLHFLLSHQYIKAAARCCAHGACFTKEQFQQIYEQLSPEEQPGWLSQLLNVNSRDQRLDTVHFLLHLRADTEMVWNGNTALMHAANGGQQAVSRLLLEHGAKVTAADSGGTTALMRAALGGHVAVVQLLLDHGANVKATEIDGTTALMHSALAGHEAVVKLLLQNGASVLKAEEDGTTALMGAALGGHTAVAKLLLEHGADVLAAEDDGMTPLMGAALDGHAAVAQLLLQYRADVAARTCSGRTALNFAAEGGHDKVVNLLVNHGADLESVDHVGKVMSVETSSDRDGMERLKKKYGAKTSKTSTDFTKTSTTICV
eukprot:s2860_g11.t1